MLPHLVGVERWYSWRREVGGLVVGVSWWFDDWRCCCCWYVQVVMRWALGVADVFAVFVLASWIHFPGQMGLSVVDHRAPIVVTRILSAQMIPFYYRNDIKDRE